jgi:hypothetical protein
MASVGYRGVETVTIFYVSLWTTPQDIFEFMLMRSNTIVLADLNLGDHFRFDQTVRSSLVPRDYC